jgi:hypothetical protein
VLAKVEEVVLGLLGVFEFENGRIWKRFDFDVMDSLHSKGKRPANPVLTTVNSISLQ